MNQRIQNFVRTLCDRSDRAEPTLWQIARAFCLTRGREIMPAGLTLFAGMIARGELVLGRNGGVTIGR